MFLKHEFVNTLVGSGLLAFSIVFMANRWEQGEKERNELQEAQSKQKALIIKLIHNGNATTEFLRNYARIAAWLDSTKGDPKALFGHVKRDDVTQASLQIFLAYTQQTRLDSLLKETDFLFRDNNEVLKASKATKIVYDEVEKKVHDPATKFDPLLASLQASLNDMIEKMEISVSK